MVSRSLLAIIAHPDDEAFGIGGTLAYYASNGSHISLVCATRGEAGEISDPGLATEENLPHVREEELRCSAEMLGIDEVIFLGYCDSGMAGSSTNDLPTAFINAPAEEVISRLVGIIRDFKPAVVLTFEPNGGYGHPDHIAIHQHTVEAFHAAADPGKFPDQGDPWQAKRLYYTAIPRSFFIAMRERLVELGDDVSEFERFEEGGGGWPDEQVDVTLDVSQWIEAKWSALNCHQTQFGSNNLFRRLPDHVAKEMMSWEYFALAWPESDRDSALIELFTDLTD